jgi:hypothetical protein
MLTYERAIICPRCGRPAPATTEEKEDDQGVRMTVARCGEKSCSFYGNLWFFAMDRQNVVVYHTIYNA